MKITLLVLTLSASVAWAWGEAGHHLTARIAAQIIEHHPSIVAERKNEPELVDDLARLFEKKRIQLGHLGGVPDTFWRSIAGPSGKPAEKMGAPTHYFDADTLPDVKSNEEFLQKRIPLAYGDARKLLNGDDESSEKFFENGTAPWRSGQLYALMRQAISKYPKKDCKEVEGFPHPTVSVLSYGGLLTHFIADSTMPYHATKDYDGVGTNQKGIHAYFETDLVDALEPGLEEKVMRRAQALLSAPAKTENSLAYFQLRMRQYYPQANGDDYATAATLVLLSNSLSKIHVVSDLDKTYALARPGERKALGCPADTTPCRRKPTTVVNAQGNLVGPKGGKAVAKWFEPFIVDRLAIASLLITDLWARAWVLNGKPKLCHTWQYAFRPNFISPADPGCFGYATEFPKPSKPTVDCLESF
jgi:hypothetical protein